MSYAIDIPPRPSVPVAGSEQTFPVGRIFCVGRNYADHAREMGHDPNREPPFFFMKPADAVVPGGGTIPYPVKTADLHHEIELVVAIGKTGVNIPVERAFDHVFGYAVGLDMTRRDLQAEAKKLQRPWEMGKAFDHAAPMSAIMPASRIGHPAQGAIWLDVNDVRKQTGDLNQQIWRVEETIAYLSQFVTVKAGDLIFNGTPAGVAAVVRGDKLHGHVAGVGELRVEYV